MAGRVTQAPLEVLVQPTTVDARVTQTALEVLVQPNTGDARVTQVALEVIILPSVLGSFTASAVVAATRAGSFTASATAIAAPVETPGDFTADAFITTTALGSFTSDAVIQREQPSTFSASATIGGGATTVPGSFTADAYVGPTRLGSFTSDAVFLRTYTFALSWVDGNWVDPNLVGSGAGIRASAVIWDGLGLATSFTADATIWGARPNTFSADASITLPFTVEASSFSADASVTLGIQTSFTLSAVIPGATTHTFTASALVRGPEYVVAETGDRIVISIDGEDITTHVILKRCEFVSQVNGQPGTCKIILYDEDRSMSFPIGSIINVRINGLMVWTGFATRIKRVYPFEAYAPVERTIEIVGVDINILFQKRIVFNRANPADGEGPKYPAYTDDTVALRALLDRYLDLSLDSLDVHTMISHIGTINEDQKANPIAPARTWGDSMRLIGSWLNPIWYIDPDRRVVWADIDVADAPFELSDNPGPGQVGMAGLRITNDASSMVNDVLLVGVSPGDDQPVYKRQEDATSIAAHNRHQFGALVNGIYKQASINRMADSYINGSTTQKRGHKDDRVSIMCTVFQHGLRAGHKVRVVSDVWGYDDVIPIRQMRLRFETSSQPRYELTLTHEFDTTWSFFDKYVPKITPPPKTDPPEPPDIPVIPGGECVDPDVYCGITDTFTRTVADGWGTSDAGLTWAVYGDEYAEGQASVSVSGGKANYSISSSTLEDDLESVDFALEGSGPGSSSDFDVTVTLTIDAMDFSTTNTTPYYTIRYGVAEVSYEGGGTYTRRLQFYVYKPTVGMYHIYIQPFVIDTGVAYKYRLKNTFGVWAGVKIWQASQAEPPAWTAEFTLSEGQSTFGGDFEIFVVPGYAGSDMLTGPLSLTFDDLDIEGVNSCAGFDDFNRTVASGWGNASSGPTWYQYSLTSPFPIIPSSYASGVNGSIGYLSTNSGGSYAENEIFVLDPGPWGVTVGGDQDFLMVTRFYMTGNTSYWGMVFGIGFSTEDIFTSIRGRYGSTPARIGYPYTTVPDFIENQWYRFKWDYSVSGGYVRVKLWKDEDPEPSAWVDEFYVGPEAQEPEFSIWVGSDATPMQTIYFDYIEFTAPAGPGESPLCPECFTADTFTRTVSGSWGTSDYGVVWETYNDDLGGYTYVHEVTGTVGRMYVSEGGGNIYSDFVYPHGQSFSVAFDFRLASSMSAEDGGWWAASFHHGGGLHPRFVMIAANTALGPYGTVAIGLASGYPAASYSRTTFDDYDPTKWFSLRWECAEGGNQQLKVWERGTAEPATWLLTDDVSTTSASIYGLAIDISSSGDDTGDIELLFDNLVICNAPPIETDGSDPTSGYTCEEFAGYAGRTSIDVAQQYATGTVEVYLNGLRQSGYSESGLRTVSIYFPTIGSDVIRVCYVIASGYSDTGGPIGGYVPI
jgi:hypothetical protein